MHCTPLLAYVFHWLYAGEIARDSELGLRLLYHKDTLASEPAHEQAELKNDVISRTRSTAGDDSLVLEVTAQQPNAPAVWVSGVESARLQGSGGADHLQVKSGPIAIEAEGSAVSVGAGGTARFAASQRLRSLSASGMGRAAVLGVGGVVLRTGALALPAGTSLDLGNGALVVEGGSLAAVTSLVKAGRGASPAGIFSSSSSPTTALAVVSNDDGSGAPVHPNFGGAPTPADAVIVKYTLHGDGDLDGRLTAADFFRIDRGRALRLAGWQEGDFNLSGGVADGDDYMLIDRAFLTQPPPGALAMATGPALPAGADEPLGQDVWSPFGTAPVTLPTAEDGEVWDSVPGSPHSQ